MSAIDRAFIRAYEIDEHAAPARAGAGIVEMPSTIAAPARRPPYIEAAVANAAPPRPHFRVVREPVPAADQRSAPGERRPLSTFATPGPTVEARFRPSLEVDAFRFSPVCDDLVHNHKARWQSAVDVLLAADDAGRSLIGIAGIIPGVGATTGVACLAQLLIDAGKENVAIVDGNFLNPGLATELGVAAECGWEDVLAGRAPLAEGVIQSINDRIALLPLVHGGTAAADGLDSIHASVTAGVLRYHYDMVLFDLGSLADAAQGPLAQQIIRQCRLDGVAIVARPEDSALVQPSRLMQMAPDAASLCLGVIENQPRTR